MAMTTETPPHANGTPWRRAGCARVALYTLDIQFILNFSMDACKDVNAETSGLYCASARTIGVTSGGQASLTCGVRGAKSTLECAIVS
jgi:hypothetical protein